MHCVLRSCAAHVHINTLYSPLWVYLIYTHSLACCVRGRLQTRQCLELRLALETTTASSCWSRRSLRQPHHHFSICRLRDTLETEFIRWIARRQCFGVHLVSRSRPLAFENKQFTRRRDEEEKTHEMKCVRYLLCLISSLDSSPISPVLRLHFSIFHFQKVNVSVRWLFILRTSRI